LPAKKQREQRAQSRDLPKLAGPEQKQALQKDYHLQPGRLRKIFQDQEPGSSDRPCQEKAQGVGLQFVPDQAAAGSDTIQRQHDEKIEIDQPMIKWPGVAPSRQTGFLDALQQFAFLEGL